MTAPYASGTITLTNGSNIITGNGTGWKTSLVAGGIVHPEAANGNSLPIVTVDSDVKITAATKWKGATGTYPYAIMRDTSYGQQTVDNAQALATLVSQLRNEMLAQLSALPPAANKVISFGEQSQAELVDLTATGKALIAALNGTAGYAALGAIPNAQLPTRLQETSPNIASTDDLNDFTNNGFYQWGSPKPVNAPFTFGFMIAVRRSAATAVQIAFNANAASPMVRYLANSVWSGWVGLALLDALGVIADGLLPARLRATAPVVTDDLDIDRDSGWYVANSPALNRPNNTDGYFWHIRNTANYQSQIFITSSATPAMFRRTKRNGPWGGWKNVDGDVSGPGAAVTSRSIAGFAGTSGQSISQLTVLEGLAALGPVFGGVAPVPSAAGVGLSDGDFNTLTVGGLYTTTGTYANGPNGNPANHAGQVEIEARYTTGLTQIYRSFNANDRGATYKRVGYRSANTDPWSWTGWIRIEAEDTVASLALSALTPAADRLLYFNGASSAALATLTSFGRSLIDDADAAAAWATLGAGQALAASGWQRLPSGLIVQWGGATSGSGGSSTVAFPTAFPNAVYRVVCSPTTPNTNTSIAFATWAGSLTQTNFILNGRYSQNGGTVSPVDVACDFIAIGR